MRGCVFLVLGVLMAMPSGARADWQGTKWGASYAETIGALAGQVQEFKPDEYRSVSTLKGQTCKAYIPSYKVADLVFDQARLCFDDQDRLSSVELVSRSINFGYLENALTSNFGAPVSGSGGAMPVRMWNDQVKGNTLRLMRVSAVILEYKPMQSGF